jgi:hypothetical protein
VTYGTLSLGAERHLRSLSVVFIFITIIISLFAAKNNYLSKFFIAYFLILGYITIIYLLTGPGIDDLTGLMDIKGIGPWFCLGLIFVSYDDYRYNLFKKTLIVSVIIISFFVLFNLKDFGIGLYRGQSLAKYRVYATNLIWISPYLFLILKNDKKLKYFRIFTLFIGIVTALITLTRSFLLIYAIVLVFDFFRTKNKGYYFIGGTIFVIIFLYILFNTQAFSTSLDLLQQRGVNDTRSDQLSQFLSQINIIDLVVGKGYNATWNFGGQAYPYLDNQWLLLIWWAGLIPAMAYFYITAIIPFKLFIRKDQDYETRVEAFVLIIWTLSCAGLSIYSTMSINFYFFVICIIQGRLLYKYSKANDNR